MEAIKELAVNPAVYGYLGMAITIIAFSLKEKHLLALCTIPPFMWGANAFLLGSITGALVQLAPLAVTAYRLSGAPDTKVRNLTLAMIGYLVLCTAFSWQGLVSMPAFVGAVFLVTALGVAKGPSIQYLLLACNTGFLVHSIIYGAHEQTITCFLSYASLMYGIYQAKKESKKGEGETPNKNLTSTPTPA